VLVSFLTGILLLTLPFFRLTETPFFLLFVGRLHPLILHFPIVLIILALVFEVAGRFYRLRVGENVVFIILIAAALSTLVSIAAGFFLFASGDYAGDLMEKHLWAGAITGAGIFFTVGLFYTYRSSGRFYYGYFAALVLTNASVGYTSHLGGSITHGQDYLSEHLGLLIHAPDDGHVKSESEWLVFEDMIQPVFEMKCLSCHNEQRAKGDLTMSAYSDLLKAGKSGHPAVIPGNATQSELYSRVMLPEDHNDHMPPQGKTPLKDAEIALLKYWITTGASPELKMADARKVDSIQPLVGALLPELAKYKRRATMERIKHNILEVELQQVALLLDVTIRRDSLADGNFFTLASKFPPTPFTNQQFQELRPYFDVFSSISLVSSGIDDAGLYYVGQMKNLRELYLQKTKLDGSGIVHLQNLRHLEVLNLSFTQVDDKAALDLLKMYALREVYLYRTRTSMQVIEALRKYKPAVSFLLQEGPYH
jgi:uncharacterized membrane protein